MQEINAPEFPDVILINPNNKYKNYNNLVELAAIEPPAWCLMLAGYLQNTGKTVKIIDANLEDLDALETASQALFHSAKVIAIVIYGQNPSSSTQLMPGVIELSKAVNTIRAKYAATSTILIGGHVAALPEQSLRETGADYVCLGEGFNAIDELVHAALGHDNMLEDIGMLRNDIYLEAARSKLVTNLDTQIPRLPWELLNMSQYRCHMENAFGYSTRTPYAAFYTSLGCPFACTFCCAQSPFKSGEKALDMKIHSYRMFSIDWVMNQFKEIHKLGITHIKIIDELFLYDTKRTEELCDRLIEKDYKFNMRAYVRLNILNKNLVHKMKKAGFNNFGVGIESLDATVRDSVDKLLKQEDIMNSIKLLKDENVTIGANYILGLPDDNIETMQKTLELAILLNTEYANFNTLIYFPGSKLYSDAIKAGIKLPTNWEAYSYYSKESLPLNTKHLSGEEVRKFRDEAFIKYYNRPEYKEMILNKYGQDAIDSVNNMLATKLNR